MKFEQGQASSPGGGSYNAGYHNGHHDGLCAGNIRKAHAIGLLEQEIETKNQRIQELLEHNNQLLDRARKAEFSLEALRNKSALT